MSDPPLTPVSLSLSLSGKAVYYKNKQWRRGRAAVGRLFFVPPVSWWQPVAALLTSRIYRTLTDVRTSNTLLSIPGVTAAWKDHPEY